MLEELSCENRVVGLKQTRRLLAAGHAGRVFLAKDADPALVEPLLAACRAVGVPAVTEFTMSQLGRAAGIAVGTAAAAVTCASGAVVSATVAICVAAIGSSVVSLA